MKVLWIIFERFFMEKVFRRLFGFDNQKLFDLNWIELLHVFRLSLHNLWPIKTTSAVMISTFRFTSSVTWDIKSSKLFHCSFVFVDWIRHDVNVSDRLQPSLLMNSHSTQMWRRQEAAIIFELKTNERKSSWKFNFLQLLVSMIKAFLIWNLIHSRTSFPRSTFTDKFIFCIFHFPNWSCSNIYFPRDENF